jgi:glycosyltransferase involved in cell wall biosynthesis
VSDGPPPPFVSVIVPVWSDSALDDCLAGLSLQTYPRDSFEVIVVDNGDQGDSTAIVDRYSGVRLEYEPRPGSYAARNKGIAVATSRDELGSGASHILAFTDADCVPHPDWLEAGVREMRRLRADVLGGRVEVTSALPGRPTAVELQDVLFAYPQERLVRDYGSGCTANLLVDRRVIDATGPFHDPLFAAGDYEFTRRAGHHGFQIVYSPEAVVSTPARRSLPALLRRSARSQGGHGELRRLRDDGAPWLQTRGRPPKPLADYRAIAVYPVPASTRLGAMVVATLVRATFKAEQVRLALGGRRLR